MTTSSRTAGPRPRRGPAVRSEKGAVTAEFAAALPVLVALVIGAVWVFGAAATQMRLTESARETARAAARGDASPESVGRRIAPADAQITLTRTDSTVEVRVSVVFQGPGGIFATVPGPTLSATSVALRER